MAEDKHCPGWSHEEAQLAASIYSLAQQRESERLVGVVKERVSEVNELNHLWQLHDFLSARRYDIEGRSELDFDTVLFIFADFVKSQLLVLDELNGLAPQKISKISAMVSYLPD